MGYLGYIALALGIGNDSVLFWIAGLVVGGVVSHVPSTRSSSLKQPIQIIQRTCWVLGFRLEAGLVIADPLVGGPGCDQLPGELSTKGHTDLLSKFDFHGCGSHGD